MTAPRFRLVWLMVAVAIGALDFTATRALLFPTDRAARDMGIFLFLGALPMANILVVGMLIAHQRPRSRPFLLGFEVFGATALAIYVAIVSGFREQALFPYLNLVIDPLEKTLRWLGPIGDPILSSVGYLMLSLPQIAWALIGGFLSRTFKITVTLR